VKLLELLETVTLLVPEVKAHGAEFSDFLYSLKMHVQSFGVIWRGINFIRLLELPEALGALSLQSSSSSSPRDSPGKC